MNSRILLTPALALSIVGCASSKIDYIPPSINKIDNQVILSDSFDVVWSRLVKNLSSDFFVINTIEKTSQIINVTFSTNSPIEFVSCGVSKREFSNARGSKYYEYDPASTSRFTFTDNNGIAFNATRESELNGRANIYVAPSENGGTVVRVNAIYVVNVKQNYTNLIGTPAGNDNFTFNFSTKQPRIGPDVVVCVTKGNLESKILDYAK